MFLAVGGPSFFQRSGVLPRRDSESGKCQDQGTNADMGLRRRSRKTAPPAADDRCLDAPSSSNPAEHFILLVPQIDESRHRHSRLPADSQPHDHFRKPSSLRVARWHFSGLHFSRPFFDFVRCHCSRGRLWRKGCRNVGLYWSLCLLRPSKTHDSSNPGQK